MKVLVTGGGGFVGRALVLKLLSLGFDVISISRGAYPELAQAGAQTVSLDLTDDRRKLTPLFEGCAAVFHTAAKVDMWGRFNEFFRVNVAGTSNVVQAAVEARVPCLIFTSSPSVVAGSTPLAGADESVPYPLRYSAPYPHTKALAEKLVLAANCPALRTVSLRPHLIFGPGDRHFVPSIIERARAGRLVQVGDGLNRVDLSFIEDCIEAHVCAFKALQSKSSPAAGRAYFISQGEPVSLWGFINRVLELSGVPPLKRRVSARGASLLAFGAEAASALTGRRLKPLFTRFLVHEMVTDHYFDISAAKRDLGYEPRFSIEQALKATFPNA